MRLRFIHVHASSRELCWNVARQARLVFRVGDASSLAGAAAPLGLNSSNGGAVRSRQVPTTLPQETLSNDYLRDFVEGIEMPLAGFFPELRAEVNELLIDTREDAIAATGLVYALPGELLCGLHPRNGGPQVTVGMPSERRVRRTVNLDLSHYRLDSGRLLGMTLLKDTLLEIIEKKKIKGGVLWASERLVGRIKFLPTRASLPSGSELIAKPADLQPITAAA